MMGSLYDVAYVTVPLLLTAILVEDAGLGAWSIAGTVCVSLGVMETVQQRRVEVKEWKVSKS
jgi:hypothetical protein